MSDSVFTLAEAAAFLQLSSKTVVKLATAGTIIGRKVGAQWRFLRSDLEAFVHGGTRQAAS
ncbi:MAG TPA: helix-turn-helix domain-containing protein [Polyangiaceae bacterium]|nr:helix-turn-helix domain-containing protein [Polyangiaceae bacterium]